MVSILSLLSGAVLACLIYGLSARYDDAVLALADDERTLEGADPVEASHRTPHRPRARATPARRQQRDDRPRLLLPQLLAERLARAGDELRGERAQILGVIFERLHAGMQPAHLQPHHLEGRGGADHVARKLEA